MLVDLSSIRVDTTHEEKTPTAGLCIRYLIIGMLIECCMERILNASIKKKRKREVSLTDRLRRNWLRELTSGYCLC